LQKAAPSTVSKCKDRKFTLVMLRGTTARKGGTSLKKRGLIYKKS